MLIDINKQHESLKENLYLIKTLLPDLYKSIKNTGDLVKELGKTLEIKEPEFELAGYYANIGLITIVNIFSNDGKLTDSDFENVKAHPKNGQDFLLQKGLVNAAEYVYLHHEKPGGKGYYKETSSITKESLLIGIADVFMGCVTPKPYKETMEIEKAINIIREEYFITTLLTEKEKEKIVDTLLSFYKSIKIILMDKTEEEELQEINNLKNEFNELINTEDYAKMEKMKHFLKKLSAEED
jgi:hypothetical protein